jgi:signal peptidase I
VVDGLGIEHAPVLGEEFDDAVGQARIPRCRRTDARYEGSRPARDGSDTIKWRARLARPAMAVSSAARSPDPQPWYERGRRGFLRFWRSENPRVSAVRDVAVAAGVVLLLLGAIWVYTGQQFPTQAPLVVVESGSMMHGPDGPCLKGSRGCAEFGRPAFGRMGTIDPGDLVLVKRVDSFDDIETAFGDGSRGGYGAHGDVLIYKRPLRGAETPVIHRAILKVFVQTEGCVPGPANGSGCTYVIPETCNAEGFASFVQPRSGGSDWRKYCAGSSEPITLDLKRGGVFLTLNGYPCATSCQAPYYSGIITKGDNNQFQDQPSPYAGEFAAGIACCPIRMDWIVGKARGEIPWFGLIKLALYGNARYQCGENQPCSDPTRGKQWTFLRATAPWDIWVMLFVSIGILIAAPVGVDFVMGRWRERRGREPPEEPPRPPARPVHRTPKPAREETKPRAKPRRRSPQR